MGAQARAQARGGDELPDRLAAMGVARHDHREQSREESRQRLVRVDQDLFLARMGGGRHHDRATARHRHQPFQLGRLGRRRRNIQLEIAGGDDAATAERGEAFRIGIRLGKADVEPAEQSGDGVGEPAPARERALRHPPVDQHHRQPPGGARQDQVRPQIRFDEQRQRRSPVIEETPDITRRIIRHVLVDHIGRETFCHDRRRRHRARGEEDAQVEGAQSLDQRRRRQHLADACAVDPDQRAVRLDVVAQAAPLADPCGIFLAEAQTSFDQSRRERHHRRRQLAIHTQRHRERASQALPPAARPRHRRVGSLRSEETPRAVEAFPWSRHRHRAARKPAQYLPLRLAQMAN